MDERFKKVEDEYFVLRGRFESGRITRDQFQTALKNMMVQDAQGRYWTIAPDTGKWHVHDGQTWIEATPPMTDLARAPTSLPERDKKIKSAVPSSRGIDPKWLFALGSVIAVCAILLLALSVAVNQGIVMIGSAPTASLAPTPLRASTGTPTPTPALAKSNVPGVNVSVVSMASPAPIAAKDFAPLNTALAGKIAALNQAELKFIRDMRASASSGKPAGLAFPLLQKGSALTDQDLKDIAGKAMDVAILADQLGEVSGKQDKGSAKAAQSADAYLAIARNAFSLVVDTQNIRQGLQSGLMPFTQAIDTIASYGAQLWNNTVTDGNTQGNPFTAQTKNAEPVQSLNPNAAAQAQSQINANNSSIWIAQSSSQNTRTLNVPAPQSPVSNPFDAQVMNSLTTANGQSDGNKAQQVAAANLQKLDTTTNSSDPSKPTQLQVPTNPVAVSGGDQIKAGNLPTFKSGKATIVSKDNPGDDNPFMQSVGLNGDQTPSNQGKIPVQDAPALVGLSITNITIDQVNKRAPGSGTFEADVNFSFTVNWNTTLAAPQFNLSCNSGSNRSITQTSGALRLQATGSLILYPGTLTVYCYANSANGQSLGSTSVNVLVGDADQATLRAIQVETDSAHLDATLTAEAVGTQRAQQTQAAGTALVIATQHALETEVAGTQAAEFKLTAAAFATRQAQPKPATATPTITPTFVPKVVDTVFHPGDEFAVNTKVVLQRGRLYRFTFSGIVNLINPTERVTANQLPEHVNGVAVPASGIVVIQGTGAVATITCSRGEADPKDPGGYTIVVEDLGPM